MSGCSEMQQREINQTGLRVSAIGLGGMRWSLQERPPEAQAIAVIHRALDLGVTFIDTADSYCLDESDKHHNERLIAKALGSYSKPTDHVVVATKGGLIRPEGRWEVDANPARLRQAIRTSFAALGGKRPIQLWQLHAPDPKFALQDVLAPVAEAVREGLILHVGVSNFAVAEIEEARAHIDIVLVQNEYSLWQRLPEHDGVLDYCDREGLAFFPYRPLGGRQRIAALGDNHTVMQLAKAKGCSPHALALAWLLAKSSRIIPIPGPTRIATMQDALTAADLTLSASEIQQLESAI